MARGLRYRSTPLTRRALFGEQLTERLRHCPPHHLTGGRRAAARRSTPTAAASGETITRLHGGDPCRAFGACQKYERRRGQPPGNGPLSECELTPTCRLGGRLGRRQLAEAAARFGLDGGGWRGSGIRSPSINPPSRAADLSRLSSRRRGWLVTDLDADPPYRTPRAPASRMAVPLACGSVRGLRTNDLQRIAAAIDGEVAASTRSTYASGWRSGRPGAAVADWCRCRPTLIRAGRLPDRACRVRTQQRHSRRRLRRDRSPPPSRGPRATRPDAAFVRRVRRGLRRILYGGCCGVTSARRVAAVGEPPAATPLRRLSARQRHPLMPAGLGGQRTRAANGCRLSLDFVILGRSKSRLCAYCRG